MEANASPGWRCGSRPGDLGLAVLAVHAGVQLLGRALGRRLPRGVPRLAGHRDVGNLWHLRRAGLLLLVLLLVLLLLMMVILLRVLLMLLVLLRRLHPARVQAVSRAGANLPQRSGRRCKTHVLWGG